MLKPTSAPRKGGFSLSAVISGFNAQLNNPLAIENFLRRHGYIVEGYNPDRDVYERVFSFGPVKVVRDLHSFTRSSKPKILAKPRTPFEVSRPGVSMVFRDAVDMARRLHKIAEKPGYNIAPSAPFIVTNRRTGIRTLLSPDRIAYARDLAHTRKFAA